MENQICQLCGATKEYKPAGKNRQGVSFQAFWGCPNWQEHKKKGEVEPRTAKVSTPAQTAPRTPVPSVSSPLPQQSDPRFAIMNRKLNRLLELAGLEQDEINSLEF